MTFSSDCLQYIGSVR